IFWFGFLGWGCVLVFCFCFLFVLVSLVYFFLFLFFLFLFFFFLFLSSLFSLLVNFNMRSPHPLPTGVVLSMLGFSLLTLLVECAWCHLPAKLLSVIVTLW